MQLIIKPQCQLRLPPEVLDCNFRAVTTGLLLQQRDAAVLSAGELYASAVLNDVKISGVQ